MRTGIDRIDDLLSDRSGATIDPNADQDAVGFVQDVLLGHDFRSLPGVLGAGRGVFGPHTTDAVRAFQQQSSLNATGTVDGPTLQALVKTPWTRPFACCAYLTVVLDVAYTGMARLVSLTAQFEGMGRFTALNRNSDGAGLSFGLIQWAQKPGRLNELLRAFQAGEPARFVDVLGGGVEETAQLLIEHTAKPRGGTNVHGLTTDPRFDLIAAPWDTRFVAAGHDPALQRVQLRTAIAAFQKSLQRLQAMMPALRSERGIAFLLDVANQHGDAGAESIIRAVQRPGISESDLLAAIQRESVARVRAQFGDGPETDSTAVRRNAFRTSPLLSDQPLAV